MKKTIFYALKQSIPIMVGYLFLGMAFGLLLQQAGYHFLWAAAISIFVYAGSLQFVMVSFLSAGTPLATVIAISLLINARHIFYGLSFIDKFKNAGKIKYLYLVFALTDETYSLLCGTEVPEDMEESDVLFWISLLDHLYWITGSVLGALAGQMISFNTKGIDFAMTALFVVIFIEQWKGAKSHVPAVTGLLSAIIFLILLGPDKFLMPSLITTVSALLLRNCRVGAGKTGEEEV